jgi:hypothetical protein
VWEEMDVDRIDALEAQWMKEPPVGMLVQAFMGYKAPTPPVQSGAAPSRASEKSKAAAIEELFKMFPTGKIKG